MQDAATITLPTDAATIAQTLNGLRVGALLRGWRGKPAADMPALIAAILAVADYAAANADDLNELDVNPLLALPSGVVAVDALINLGGNAP